MKLFAGAVLVSCFVISSAYTQNLRPPIPFFDYGACPFECCTYRRWSVEADTVLFKQRSAKSGVAFRVKKGEHVAGLTGVVITLKPGQAVAKSTSTTTTSARNIRLRPGDTLYLLTYEGEDVFKIWYRGKIFEANTYMNQKDIKLLDRPQAVWWVKVKNSRGQVGWTKQNQNFGDIDACG